MRVLFKGKLIGKNEWVYGTYHYSNDNKYHYILNREKFLERDGEMVLHNQEVHLVDGDSVIQIDDDTHHPIINPKENNENITHKDVHGVVKELYHKKGWGRIPEFIKDVMTKSAEDFAIQSHMSLGMHIRNNFGLWKENTDLYKWFIQQNITHPDEMSHQILLELYKYAQEQLKIE